MKTLYQISSSFSFAMMACRLLKARSKCGITGYKEPFLWQDLDIPVMGPLDEHLTTFNYHQQPFLDLYKGPSVL